jgi:glycosyltransferase involved in cell wall biosynthesis
MLGRGNCRIIDETGRSDRITYHCILPRLFELVRDAAAIPPTIRRVQHDVRRRLWRARQEARAGRPFDSTAPSVYLRALPDYGLRAGGSVGHIAGVLNNLGAFTGPPVFLTTAAIPTVRPEIATHYIPQHSRLRNFPEVRMADASRRNLDWATPLLQGRPVSLFYQRYSLYDYSGLLLADRRAEPLVIEYNGSEVWVGKNWGRRLKYERLAAEIELLNLHAADLVVVVSKPLRDEIVLRGVDPGKILVNPNGVEPDRYSPEIQGVEIRQRYGLAGKSVVGFIGTFGPWHGAEVLADAFGRLVAAHPAYRDNLRLLLIGDGVKMNEVRGNLDRHGVEDLAVLTGIVPQAEGPRHLAACDILASPHVPNPDGTPFFGSPTKLFEYMAMGKGIVASNLEQIGEILEHDRTAWMVRPGDVDNLAGGLRVLIEDPTRRSRLGAAARAEVVAKYTWKEHTRKIIDALRGRCS